MTLNEPCFKKVTMNPQRRCDGYVVQGEIPSSFQKHQSENFLHFKCNESFVIKHLRGHPVEDTLEMCPLFLFLYMKGSMVCEEKMTHI